MALLACTVNPGDEKLAKRMLKAVEGGKSTESRFLSLDGMSFAATGAEAFQSADGKQAIILNGTLFNADNLKPLLKPKVKSDSFAEIVLSLHKMKGRQCVHYLDGTFAFMMADGKDFYAARDPLGAKPLYFTRSDGGWLFASELKAFPKEVKRVSEFPPGCYLDSDGAKRYFKLPDAPTKQVNVPEAVELLRALISESIEKHIKPHGEVGIYLTGSLESCIAAALAASHVKRIKTYSVGLEGSSDANTAKRVASWLSTDHTHVEVSAQDVLDSVQTVVQALESYDAGLVRNAVADHFVCKAAAGQVKYLISGDGANELFGGYAYLRPMFSEKLAQEIRRITEDLHRTNLLRWERITSLHGLDARIPFIDRKLVHAAFCLPANLKINEEGRSKWILRRTFSTLLPAWVVDRPDNDDTLHTGIHQALQEYAETVYTDDDLKSVQDGDAMPALRTKDELLYHQIWSALFPPEFAQLVGRTHV